VTPRRSRDDFIHRSHQATTPAHRPHHAQRRQSSASSGLAAPTAGSGRSARPPIPNHAAYWGARSRAGHRPPCMGQRHRRDCHSWQPMVEFAIAWLVAHGHRRARGRNLTALAARVAASARADRSPWRWITTKVAGARPPHSSVEKPNDRPHFHVPVLPGSRVHALTHLLADSANPRLITPYDHQVTRTLVQYHPGRSRVPTKAPGVYDHVINLWGIRSESPWLGGKRYEAICVEICCHALARQRANGWKRGTKRRPSAES
jgi:hypothetical protein